MDSLDSILTNRTHFWGRLSGSYSSLVRLHHAQKDSAASNVNEVYNTWSSICRMYFTGNAVSPDGPRWIDKPEGFKDRPGVILRTSLERQIKPGALSGWHKTNVLWVVCKPYQDDNEAGWIDTFEEVARRLGVEHPGRSIWVLLAVGRKCMFFVWRPDAEKGNPMFIRREADHEKWNVDERLRPIWTLPWVDCLTGEIEVGKAFELDAWSLTTGEDGRKSLENELAFRMIEFFLLTVQNSANEGELPL